MVVGFFCCFVSLVHATVHDAWQYQPSIICQVIECVKGNPKISQFTTTITCPITFRHFIEKLFGISTVIVGDLKRMGYRHLYNKDRKAESSEKKKRGMRFLLKNWMLTYQIVPIFKFMNAHSAIIHISLDYLLDISLVNHHQYIAPIICFS